MARLERNSIVLAPEQGAEYRQWQAQPIGEEQTAEYRDACRHEQGRQDARLLAGEGGYECGEKRHRQHAQRRGEQRETDRCCRYETDWPPGDACALGCEPISLQSVERDRQSDPNENDRQGKREQAWSHIPYRAHLQAERRLISVGEAKCDEHRACRDFLAANCQVIPSFTVNPTADFPCGGELLTVMVSAVQESCTAMSNPYWWRFRM